ncbi:flavin-containing monooxygenase [Agitococcus lubricus]|uniref:Cation diffusion facilitator CzcD-associated flavoprotein CzcO n=1 Tax=Agitococcus lubricus TaxID=1077255 RepID=A0A2T5J301_9GAMM|nr:NAD(P)/FAD-dependent oxidoreductase [Agitococcus lubricus]PTQ90946.1 cation diffusion facilitator CzcD-associated flavoprotein CzcO [Agitococcus lubricus]
MAEKFDVLIVGAGLSGIGAACHLKRECPNKRFVILEGRDAMGGTWDLFRYPGIRSDSDMYTLGYNFKPWTNPKAIADGHSIRDYIHEAAREYDVNRHIRFGHKVHKAAWSSAKSLWTIEATNKVGEVVLIEANFVISCTGYYNYEAGYTPEFKGRERFQGQIIHPQFWPENLDYTGKKVVVIGSGATAVTLVPSMADKTAHITMLQRSPSYVISVPQEDIVSNKLRKYLPEKVVYHMARVRNVGLSLGLYRYSRAKPEAMRRFLLSQVRRQLGQDAEMSHFSPSYKPWDERLCAVPNGDLFKAIRKGKASVVTDHIDSFTENGILLKSGKTLDADIIITATGLDIKLMGGTRIEVDGKPFDVTQKMSYKGAMLEDLPNAAMIFGYTNASWTLKADIISEYICRLLTHMDNKGLRQCMPHNNDPTVEKLPFIDMQSGYVQRAVSRMPYQGSKAPWRLYQNYAKDYALMRFGRLDDGVMRFS